MEAALSLFGTRGYDDTSIDAIARKAGVAKGLVYNYFESKEDLLEQVLVDGFRAFDSLLCELRSIDDPKRRIRRMLEASAETIEDREEFFRLYFSLPIQLHRRPRLKDLSTRYFEQLLTALEQMLRDAGVPNPRTEAYKLGGLLDGVGVDYMLFGKERYPLREVLESVYEDLLGRMESSNT